jgi:hypothetical protein
LFLCHQPMLERRGGFAYAVGRNYYLLICSCSGKYSPTEIAILGRPR